MSSKKESSKLKSVTKSKGLTKKKKSVKKSKKRYTIIGEITSMGAIPSHFFEDKDKNIYLSPQKIFEMMPLEKQKEQQIIRMINNTVFLKNGRTRELLVGQDITKLLKERMQEDLNDAKLREIIKLCEGADMSDKGIFVNIKTIEKWQELESMKGGLTTGLGFPGGSASIIEAEDFDGNKVTLIQEVGSYMEGYTVEHYPMTEVDYLRWQKAKNRKMNFRDQLRSEEIKGEGVLFESRVESFDHTIKRLEEWKLNIYQGDELYINLTGEKVESENARLLLKWLPSKKAYYLIDIIK